MRLQKQVRIFLILSSISLSSCTTFPTLHPRIISLKNNACGEYEVVKQKDACDIQWKFKEWHPIEYCEGNFAIPASDVTSLLKYQKEICTNNPQKCGLENEVKSK